MNNDREAKSLEVGDIISLDDENGNVVGDFEVIAVYEANQKPYVALTPALDEDAAAEDELEEEVEIFVLGIDGEELIPLEPEEEEAAYAKLDEILEDIELIDEHDHAHDHK